MRTEPLYLTEPYRKTMQATVLDILPEAHRRLRVMLDRTVFCPTPAKSGGSRGGRPADQGWLSARVEDEPDEALTSPEFKLIKAEIQRGEIWHYLEPAQPKDAEPLQIGQTVTAGLEWEPRYMLMRICTAGFGLHFALHRLGLFPDQLKPLRAGFGNPTYLIYEGANSTAFAPEYAPKLDQLQTQLNRLLEAGLEVKSRYYTSSEQIPTIETELYRETNLLPEQGLIQIELENIGSIILSAEQSGYPLVANTREIGRIAIGSIETADEQLKINFQLED